MPKDSTETQGGSSLQPDCCMANQRSDQSTREIWNQFHKLWGLAHDHDYQKPEWGKLQNMLEKRIGYHL